MDWGVGGVLSGGRASDLGVLAGGVDEGVCLVFPGASAGLGAGAATSPACVQMLLADYCTAANAIQGECLIKAVKLQMCCQATPMVMPQWRAHVLLLLLL